MSHLPADTHLGYVNLRVPDVLPSLGFYRELLGFRVIREEENLALLSASGHYPAQIILTGQRGARRKPARTTGLYHVAIRFGNRRALARVFRRLAEHGWPLHGNADHGVSEAIYLPDPDNNGVELYVDRAPEQWRYDENGQVMMVTEALDIPDLLATAQDGAPWDGIDPLTDIGHIHLQVSRLRDAEAFYCDILGLDVTQRSYPGALFVAAGGYHHHIGLNTWIGEGAPPPPPDSIGLIEYALVIPAGWDAAVDRIQAAGGLVEDHPDGAVVRDPDGIGVVLVPG
ncbi:MAG TPA: VOC family protein [Aggregatilineaceae bacterium]|nr:VOC family protein [Aggregatilineaceae bacterium]